MPLPGKEKREGGSSMVARRRTRRVGDEKKLKLVWIDEM